jgi:hypothetical protein
MEGHLGLRSARGLILLPVEIYSGEIANAKKISLRQYSAFELQRPPPALNRTIGLER